MARVLLARHGETDLNSARMFVGHNDVELSPLGRRQVERLRDRLAEEKIDVVYSSDLRRALMTAETIASRHRVEVIICPELREINYGKVDGVTFDDISRLYPDVAEMCVEWSLRLKFPGGESVAGLRKRLALFLGRLKEHAPEQTVLVVAHGGPLRIMICSLLGIHVCHWRQVQIDLASLSMVEQYPDVALIRLLNDTSHLKGL